MYKNLKIAVTASLLMFAGLAAQAAETGGFATTMGGDDKKAVVVSTLSELKDAVDSGKHHIVVRGHIYGGPQLTTLNFNSTDWNNTTIEGEAGGKAALENIQLKFNAEKLPAGTYIENIKVANLTFFGRITDLQAMPQQVFGTDAKDGINYLGVSLRRINNVLITHCAIYDTSDDLMSATQASDNITLAYNHFYFTDEWVKMEPDPVWNWVGKFQNLSNERLTMVIGMNPKDSFEVTGKLHATLHHNWFGPNLRGRPLLRGWVHAYSNYFDNSTTPKGKRPAADGNVYANSQQYNALQIGSGGTIYSESNSFFKTNVSHQIGLDKPTDNYQFFERDNVYAQTTGASAEGKPFTAIDVKYAYKATPAAEVPEAVKASAGPQ